jgi:hypothetical protein
MLATNFCMMVQFGKCERPQQSLLLHVLPAAEARGLTQHGVNESPALGLLHSLSLYSVMCGFVASRSL